jgi:hypothetical protein
MMAQKIARLKTMEWKALSERAFGLVDQAADLPKTSERGVALRDLCHQKKHECELLHTRTLRQRLWRTRCYSARKL